MIQNSPRKADYQRFVSRTSHRRIVTNTAWLLADKAIGAAIGVIVGIFVARYLRPASFGLYSYALAIVQIPAAMAGLGLRDIVVRDIVREPMVKDEILGTALMLRFGASSVLVALLVVSMATGIGPQETVLRWLIGIMSFQLLFGALSEIVACWFESQVQSKYVVWARNCALMFGSSLKVGLILACAQVVAFGVVTVVQAMVFSAGAVVLFHTVGNNWSSLRVSIARAKQMLSDSWPFMFSALAVMIYMRIDQIMLGHLAGAESLGKYSVAVRISEIWFLVPVAVAASLFPSIVRSRESQCDDGHRIRVQSFFDIMAAMAYSVILPVTLIASPLVIALFGAEYAEAGPILRVHVWSLIFVALGVARGRWLVAENRASFAMFATVLGSVVNIGLNLLLIPQFGGLGAAWATLLSQALSSYISGLLYLPLWPVFRQATLAMFVPLRPLPLLRMLREIGFGRASPS